MYPFASQNTLDLENLRDVYTDAVFFPLLKRDDFNQEGWRLEHERIDGAPIAQHCYNDDRRQIANRL
jgi:Zn-dependent M16 (insulinase) family peptidase